MVAEPRNSELFGCEDMAEKADEDSYASVDLVCALCDNGGEIASCEGRCLRSFHATNNSGEDCQTLGYSRQQFNAMKVFTCKNCEYEIYQCFACGRLGSAKTDSPEVFPCASATCGQFYHAKCVAQLLFPENEAKATEYMSKIADGAKFACPLHKCHVCKKIAFEDFTENGQFFFQRAWDDLLPNNRILIYCLYVYDLFPATKKHDIDPKHRTPTRNHIKFPKDPIAIVKPLNDVNRMNKKIIKIQRIEELPFAPKDTVKRYFGTVKYASVNNVMNKRRKVHVSGEKSVVMSKLPLSSFPEIDKNTEMRQVYPLLTAICIPVSLLHCSSNAFLLMHEFAQQTTADITFEDVQKKLVVPSTHTPSLQNMSKITLGQVERSVEAVKASLHMLENGACIEDAKSVCSPSDLFTLAKWKNKLSVYLAPFLHGMRYTSYGRHFTKLDKLQQIVDKLQWYIQSGDTVVDFCCGSNDFSLLLKEKLEASGKKCFYKNYDLIQPKNAFNFERRDWMTVQPDELPTGCRLIMGLNPPFGFKASLANQFINKALTFKPKLIIVIVPKETERLDKKYPPYELIWQDSNHLSGKSFYLPGCLDADNKVMEQWNASAPPLSLWSRSDWAKRHLEVAKSMRHLPASSGDFQREFVDVPTSGHAEMDDTEGAGIPSSFLDHLLSDTFHDPTSTQGDYWNDTNGRSRQPCNYETPGRSDPTYDHHKETCSGTDMSISLPASDCERQDRASSVSERGCANSQSCDADGSVSAEKPSAGADCDEVTSAAGPYKLPEDPSKASRHAAGVQYWMMEDSPLVEVGELSDAPPVDRPAAGTLHQRMEDTLPVAMPEADSQCGQPEDSRPSACHNARALPPGYTFPGLRLQKGCNDPHQFPSQGIGYPAVHQGLSSSWFNDCDY
ncbi:hypothetical protein U9M48_038370 [Paspalum notatum var. saurae]|uniref:Protein ENHANCED DOWNY MILDEW 2 n=1 Tax=Paspalum notatum var. saurae TaxID=547442 RepID=A0AAQ3XB06_PASNO